MENEPTVNSIEVLEKKMVSSFGRYDCQVRAAFTINEEVYEVTYRRLEPKAYIRIDNIELPKVTTENTFSEEALSQDYSYLIEDALNA